MTTKIIITIYITKILSYTISIIIWKNYIGYQLKLIIISILKFYLFIHFFYKSFFYKQRSDWIIILLGLIVLILSPIVIDFLLISFNPPTNMFFLYDPEILEIAIEHADQIQNLDRFLDINEKFKDMIFMDYVLRFFIAYLLTILIIILKWY